MGSLLHHSLDFHLFSHIRKKRFVSKKLQILNVTCAAAADKSVLYIKLSQMTWCLLTCWIPAQRFWFDSGTVIKVRPLFPSSMVNPDVSGRKDLPRRRTSGLRNRLFSLACGWTATCGRSCSTLTCWNTVRPQWTRCCGERREATRTNSCLRDQ